MRNEQAPALMILFNPELQGCMEIYSPSFAALDE
jgi:hypothetical protein